MNLKIGRFKHKFTAENKMKMQIANAIFQNLFQIWIDSKTKKERLIFFSLSVRIALILSKHVFLYGSTLN